MSKQCQRALKKALIREKTDSRERILNSVFGTQKYGLLMEKLKEYNMLEPQIVVFRNALIEKGFTLSRNARTLEQIADEVARQVKR